MFTVDVLFEGWTVTDWARFLELFAPRSTAQVPAKDDSSPRGGLVVIHDGNRVLKLLHTERGRIEPQLSWPIPLGALAAEHSASYAVSIYFGALDEVMERFGARVRRGDTITEQSLTLMHIFREMTIEGVIETWPERLRSFPIPTPQMVNRAVDAFCPSGTCFVLAAFDEGDLYTACVLRRAGKEFDLIAGPDELRGRTGLLSGEVRRDYRHVASAIESKYGPIGFGCYARMDTLRALPLDTRPGAWARAVAVRDVILSPVPFGIGFAVGLDVLRALLTKVGEALPDVHLFPAASERLRSGRFEPLMGRLQRSVGTVTGTDVLTALGFDPLTALRLLIKR